MGNTYSRSNGDYSTSMSTTMIRESRSSETSVACEWGGVTVSVEIPESVVSMQLRTSMPWPGKNQRCVDAGPAPRIVLRE